ncbi:hypothetical protein H632_c996p1 [Helicosporidium sp. ATCC 50920]|nr:hypothetical protein H632_c996p1 [Helicosporidium sp. ATCC 50920]|eukprot:KDD74907.1 hypothetical protein H632_c996p1 [Helicosporidium sp. ATCC 50920]
MSHNILRLATLAIVCLCVAHALDWEDCGDAENAFAVSSVDLTPNPVNRGTKAHFAINGNSTLNVDAGSISMTVRYLGFPIWYQTDNLCEKTTCPVQPGEVEIIFDQLFPKFTPTGSYSLTLQGSNGDQGLFCIKASFEVVSASLADAMWERMQEIQDGVSELAGQVVQSLSDWINPPRKALVATF